MSVSKPSLEDEVKMWLEDTCRAAFLEEEDEHDSFHPKEPALNYILKPISKEFYAEELRSEVYTGTLGPVVYITQLARCVSVFESALASLSCHTGMETTFIPSATVANIPRDAGPLLRGVQSLMTTCILKLGTCNVNLPKVLHMCVGNVTHAAALAGSRAYWRRDVEEADAQEETVNGIASVIRGHNAHRAVIWRHLETERKRLLSLGKYRHNAHVERIIYRLLEKDDQESEKEASTSANAPEPASRS